MLTLIMSTYLSLVKVICADGEYSRVSDLLLTTPAKALQSLFHGPSGSFNNVTLLIFVPYVFFISCITYGISVPCGLFIPSLLLGATWGRVIGGKIHLLSCLNCHFSPFPIYLNSLLK